MRFKFKEAWLLWAEYEDVVRAMWTTNEEALLALGDVKEKITRCRTDLHA